MEQYYETYKCTSRARRVGACAHRSCLIHLGIIPGGMQGPDGRTGWLGASWLLDHVLSTSVIWAIAVVLVAGTIVFFVAGGLGLVGIPLLKGRWKAATIVACSLSLLLF